MSKLRYLLVLSLVATATQLAAQVELGIDLGTSISHSNRPDETYFDRGRCASFLPGVHVGYTFSEHWRINSGLRLLGEGFSVTPINGMQGDAGKCRFRYASLPAYFAYQHEIGNFFLAALGGLQFDFYMSQQTPVYTYNGEEQHRYQLDEKEMNHGIEMILGAEAGHRLNNNWSIVATYLYGFDFINADKRTFHGKFRTHQITVGIRYRFENVTKVESFDSLNEDVIIQESSIDSE